MIWGLQFLYNMVMSANAVLSRFHPLIARWFLSQFPAPTGVQAQSWERIAGGQHVLITAPTGSGKTFAAFLWAIDRLVTGKFESGHTSVLYVSPLRALNNDIRRNLLAPLEQLKRNFERAGETFPEIRVETRSGDTPASERERMQRHPPEILITTPESLNLLLTSAGGRSMLRGISVVIIDEVHAVLGTKRGAFLMTAVERLVLLSGEFQRIALSATVQPLETAAKFIGGFTISGSAVAPVYSPRAVAIVPPAGKRQYQLTVRFPERELGQMDDSIWDPLVVEFKKIIRRNRTTLFFANSRRLCEKLAMKINDGEEPQLIFVHHGSLSREVRQTVEQRLRQGELRAVIATNSLELGIDIGALDEVVLVQCPMSVSAAIQRVGRSRHQVGQVCRGLVFPTYSRDLLEAAVLAPAIVAEDLEAIEPVHAPLDVLAQVIVAMVGVEKWDIDALFAHVTTSYPFRLLGRVEFDLVLNMLAGRYADTQIRELRPQVSIDRVDNTVEARKGALLAIYTSGGVIPDRGYFHLRHSETNSLIGELDEEFVWEASVGQTFSLGAQNWKIERITHNDVFVLPGNPKVLATPFWKGEENFRDFHFSERLGAFLEDANDRLDDPAFAAELEHKHFMETSAAQQLVDFLKRQKELTRADLPHRHHLLLESVSSGPGGAPGNQIVLHTTWGNRLNRPFALALDAAWEERFKERLEVYVANDCIVFLLPDGVDAEQVLSLVSSATVERFLRKRLESSGFFGARFRECAGRALLLPRNRIGQRMPLWMNRLRSQKLLNAVLRYEDFPVLLETWRTCLQDEFDMENLKRVLSELEAGVTIWSEAHTTSPSPFAQDITWRQISEYMYMGDEPAAGASRLRSDLLAHVVFSPEVRPTIASSLIQQFESKRQRLAPGYSPETPRELVDWVKERLLIQEPEWERLLEAMRRDHGIDPRAMVEEVASRLVRIVAPGTSGPSIVSVETLPRLTFGLFDGGEVALQSLGSLPPPQLPQQRVHPETQEAEGDADEAMTAIVGEWLSFYGPVRAEFIERSLGVAESRLSLAIEDLIESQDVISGKLVTGGPEDGICDTENFEILLRLARRAAIPVFEPKQTEALPLFLAQHQGVIAGNSDVDHLFHCIEQLRCLPAPAPLWESEILPARLHTYNPSSLDAIMQEGELKWIGSGNHLIAFSSGAELPLLQEEDSPEDQAPAPDDGTVGLFPGKIGRYDFATLLTTTNLSASELSTRLWEAVWRGRVTNDSIAALRKGIMNRFRVPTASGVETTRPHHGYRSGFSRWKGSIPFAGNWYLLPAADPAGDPLEELEKAKDRARVLLDRYGILFREIAERESPAFRWGRVFRALRLMELSGEILSGYFFEGIPGPQFISHQAFQSLQRRLPAKQIFWLNAADPASLCGVHLNSLKDELPNRVPGAHIVYRGEQLVVVSRRNGQELTISVPQDDPDLQQCFGFLHHLLNRSFQPLHRVIVSAINGEAAAGSPYLDHLKTGFHVTVDYRNAILYKS